MTTEGPRAAGEAAPAPAVQQALAPPGSVPMLAPAEAQKEKKKEGEPKKEAATAKPGNGKGTTEETEAIPKRRNINSLVGGTFTQGDYKWQWMHKTGWKDYAEVESDRIEKYYQLGEWMMRLKSGSGKNAKPREIFFYDKVQYCPNSQSQRQIRRTPEEGPIQKIARRCNCALRGFLQGDEEWWKAKDKAYFEGQRASGSFTADEEILATYRVFSRWYRIVNSWMFGGFSMLAIMLNACWIFVDADYNDGNTVYDTDVVFIIMDNLFTIWFTVEILFRYLAFQRTRDFFKDRWIIFDFTLVCLMIFETWLLQIGLWIALDAGDTAHMNKLSVLRVLRLLRLSRITRLFKVFPQLFILVKGVGQAMRSLVYTVLLLFVLLFMFGVVFRNLAEMDDSSNLGTAPPMGLGCGSVGGAMWMLLLYGVFMDSVGEKLNQLFDISVWHAFVFIVFIFLSNLTMLNMLIGILCEVVAAVTSEETDLSEKVVLENQLLEILECYDIEDDKHLRKSEFSQLMSNPDLQLVFSRHGIDPADMAKLEDVLFQENDDGEGDNPTKAFKEISYPEFLDKVFQLRSGNSATVTDMVELRAYLNQRFSRIEEKASMLSRPCSPALPRAPPAFDPAKAIAPPESRSAGEAESNNATAEFQEAVLSQLSQLKMGQDILRSEVSALQDKVEELQEENAKLRATTAAGEPAVALTS